jgi:2-oxo-4-hydroxy-4-carboxy-5-ureidoimidazoline decarboxylase
VRRLNHLPAGEDRQALLACCASTRWVDRMLSQRPFKDANEVFTAATRLWNDLGREDWLEAFAAHPRLGESRPGGQAGRRAEPAPGHGALGEAWSETEQAGVGSADADVKAALAQANRDYEAKFGWIYLACATGRSAEELLDLARRRMANAPDEELKVAAAEQDRITRLRLEKLLAIGDR